MSTKTGLVVREGKNGEQISKGNMYKFQYTKRFFINNCIEDMWTTTMICVLTEK